MSRINSQQMRSVRPFVKITLVIGWAMFVYDEKTFKMDKAITLNSKKTSSIAGKMIEQ